MKIKIPANKAKLACKLSSDDAHLLEVLTRKKVHLYGSKYSVFKIDGSEGFRHSNFENPQRHIVSREEYFAFCLGMAEIVVEKVAEWGGKPVKLDGSNIVFNNMEINIEELRIKLTPIKHLKPYMSIWGCQFSLKSLEGLLDELS